MLVFTDNNSCTYPCAYITIYYTYTVLIHNKCTINGAPKINLKYKITLCYENIMMLT